MLRKNFFSAEQTAMVIRDFHTAGLNPDEVAIMDFARKATAHAHQVSQADWDRLKQFNLSEVEILDILLVATARAFYSMIVDSLGVEVDAAYLNLEDELLQAATVGRSMTRH